MSPQITLIDALGREHPVVVIRPGETAYPLRLRGPTARPLHVAGALSDREPVVAIVGARAASATGLRQARGLAADLAASGALVVSGGALGIDAAAHGGALDAGAATLAVLGVGLDAPYPERNRPLFAAILAAGGALVSTFPPGSGVHAGQFVARNGTIAALADLVVVVEAGARSGSLHTARAAAARGRGLGAVPGSPGTAALLAAGAVEIRGADDVHRALAGGAAAAPPAPPAGSDEAAVLGALVHPHTADELAELAGLDARRLVRALVALEALGLIWPGAGGRYTRNPSRPADATLLEDSPS